MEPQTNIFRRRPHNPSASVPEAGLSEEEMHMYCLLNRLMSPVITSTSQPTASRPARPVNSHTAGS